MTAATTTLTSREFNQDTGMAKKAAASGPVIITDRGKPLHALKLSLEQLEALAKAWQDIKAMAPAPAARQGDPS